MQKKIITQGQISQEHIKLNFSWRAFGRNMHLVIESRVIEWHPIFKYNYVIVIDPMIDLMLERFSTIEIILFILRGSPCLSFPHQSPDADSALTICMIKSFISFISVSKICKSKKESNFATWGIKVESVINVDTADFKIDLIFLLQVIPGRMTLLITVFLVLINIFNTIQTNSPKVNIAQSALNFLRNITISLTRHK